MRLVLAGGFTILLSIAAGPTAHARAPGFSVGGVVGEPVGGSAAYRFNERLAVQSHLGWRFSQRRFHWSFDGVYDLVDIPTDDAMGFTYPVYMGLGFRVLSGNSYDLSSSMGMRIPMGVAVIPESSRVEVFLELAPVIELVPSGPVGLDAVLGCRVAL